MKIRRWSQQFRGHCSSVGARLSILGPCMMTSARNITVGDDLTVRSRKHNMVEISCEPGARLTLGNNVFLNQGVRIACTQTKAGPVVIEPNVWLGSRVMVLRGVTIGRGSVVGAGSVVTRSIPPGVFAAGVPARVVKNISAAS